MLREGRLALPRGPWAWEILATEANFHLLPLQSGRYSIFSPSPR
jgi:hypothetical protein